MAFVANIMALAELESMSLSAFISTLRATTVFPHVSLLLFVAMVLNYTTSDLCVPTYMFDASSTMYYHDLSTTLQDVFKYNLSMLHKRFRSNNFSSSIHSSQLSYSRLYIELPPSRSSCFTTFNHGLADADRFAKCWFI